MSSFAQNSCSPDGVDGWVNFLHTETIGRGHEECQREGFQAMHHAMGWEDDKAGASMFTKSS